MWGDSRETLPRGGNIFGAVPHNRNGKNTGLGKFVFAGFTTRGHTGSCCNQGTYAASELQDKVQRAEGEMRCPKQHARHCERAPQPTKHGNRKNTAGVTHLDWPRFQLSRPSRLEGGPPKVHPSYRRIPRLIRRAPHASLTGQGDILRLCTVNCACFINSCSPFQPGGRRYYGNLLGRLGVAVPEARMSPRFRKVRREIVAERNRDRAKNESRPATCR